MRFIRFALLIATAFGLSACSTPDLFVQEARYFEEQVKGHPGLTFAPPQEQSFRLNYVSIGDRSKPALVFIHGTPGSWRNASRYLMDEQLQNRAYLVAIDRPGWGESRFQGKKVEPSFSAQARLMKPLLEALQQQNHGAGVILVGHSLGASLAPKIAMDYPHLVDGLILLSGSLDPGLGKPRWYNRAATMGVVSWFLDPGLRKANREIMPLHKELHNMLPAWQNIRIPVTLIQGMKDELVFPENADFAERVMVNADLKVIRLAQAGHFVPWENRTTVRAEINALLTKLNSR